MLTLYMRDVSMLGAGRPELLTRFENLRDALEGFKFPE